MGFFLPEVFERAERFTYDFIKAELFSKALWFGFIAIFFMSVGMGLLGCARKESPFIGIPVKNPAAAWVQHQKVLQKIQTWKLEGMVGISDGNQAQSIDVSWRQDPTGYEMDFYGPLNIKIGSLIKNSDGLFLISSNQKLNQKLKADNPESLMDEEFGWSLPIRGLIDWIRGLPSALSSSKSNQELNAFGYLAALQDQGWSITYLNYQSSQDSQDSIALPTRMILKQGDIRVVLVIKKWEI